VLVSNFKTKCVDLLGSTSTFSSHDVPDYYYALNLYISSTSNRFALLDGLNNIRYPIDVVLVNDTLPSIIESCANLNGIMCMIVSEYVTCFMPQDTSAIQFGGPSNVTEYEYWVPNFLPAQQMLCDRSVILKHNSTCYSFFAKDTTMTTHTFSLPIQLVYFDDYNDDFQNPHEVLVFRDSTQDLRSIDGGKTFVARMFSDIKYKIISSGGLSHCTSYLNNTYSCNLIIPDVPSNKSQFAAGNTPVKKFVVNDFSACILFTNMTFNCYNHYFFDQSIQIGVNATNKPGIVKDIEMLSSGVVVIDTNGYVWYVGDATTNIVDQTTLNYIVIPNLDRIVSLSSTYGSFCALRDDYSLWCDGYFGYLPQRSLFKPTRMRGIGSEKSLIPTLAPTPAPTPE
jgi:hypothetical protein